MISVWICPHPYFDADWGNVQTTFRRLLACLLVLPGQYRQAIEEHNRTHPTHPFEAQIGPTFILH